MQDTPKDTRRVAAAELSQFIERYERLEAKKKILRIFRKK